MKTNLRTGISIILLMAVTLACGGTAATATAPTEDPANMINTAIAGTQQSQALAQATVNSTTLTAMPAPVTPTPGPTVEYVTLTEEELAALIDEAVAEAVTATEQTTTEKSKSNGQQKGKQPRVITSPNDVAGLVMMQIDAVNSKKDDLTIAIKGMADAT